jgi:hypothetical protein
MIHIATVHHRSNQWIDIQRQYLARNLPDSFRVYAALEGVVGLTGGEFDVVVPSMGPHAGKLNLLGRVVLEHAEPDDVLVFLDGDAFPIADPMPLVREALASVPLVAVRRNENLGDRQPHPCFCATTADFWDSIRGDWSSGATWTAANGTDVSDVGGNLLWALERRAIKWTKIRRTRSVGRHPLFFGIYGDVLYHHGAGFRSGRSRFDGSTIPRFMRLLPRALGISAAADQAWRLGRSQVNRRASAALYKELVGDPGFFDDLDRFALC